jgi:hypothetical protein
MDRSDRANKSLARGRHGYGERPRRRCADVLDQAAPPLGVVRSHDGASIRQAGRVLWGTTHGSYPNSVTLMNPGLSTYVVGNLAPATYYFVVRAIDASGRESTNSNAAQKTISP